MKGRQANQLQIHLNYYFNSLKFDLIEGDIGQNDYKPIWRWSQHDNASILCHDSFSDKQKNLLLTTGSPFFIPNTCSTPLWSPTATYNMRNNRYQWVAKS
jgi:hypothetical protein